MKLKELLENVEELSKLTSGELTVKFNCDFGVEKDIPLKSKSSVPKVEITIKYPEKKK